MSPRQIDIADMQCWVFRMAQKKWRLDARGCMDIFTANGVLDYIADCYDMLHLSSYECALDDVEHYLANKGVVVC